MNKHESIELIAKCMRLRDKSFEMARDELIVLIKDIASYNVISARQIARLSQGAISASSVTRIVKKRTKTGGKLNPESLEAIREIIFEFDLGRVDWQKVLGVISSGTSVEVFVRLSGISRSTLYRKIRHGLVL
jgi:hypothetical protein